MSQKQTRTNPHKDFSRRERLTNKKINKTVLGSVSTITKIKQGNNLGKGPSDKWAQKN